MSFNGNLTINLCQQAERVAQLDIELSRPALAQKLLVNQASTQAPKRLGQLLSVCRYAQSMAATLATSAPDKSNDIIEQHYQGLMIENITQLLWRLCLELPALANSAFNINHYKNFQNKSLSLLKQRELNQKNLSKQDKADFTEVVQALVVELSGIHLSEFIQLSASDYQNWLKTNNVLANVFRQLPKTRVNISQTIIGKRLSEQLNEQSCQQLLAAMQTDSSFCQQPQLAQQCFYTHPLCYIGEHQLTNLLLQMNNSVFAGFYLAKLVYLQQCLNLLNQGLIHTSATLAGSYQQDEQQLAWVQTARGLLIHRCQLDTSSSSDTQASQIKHYEICAPTEWNFHPQGVFADLLSKAVFKSNFPIANQARLAVIAFDPCIDFTLGVTNA